MSLLRLHVLVGPTYILDFRVAVILSGISFWFFLVYLPITTIMFRFPNLSALKQQPFILTHGFIGRQWGAWI